MAQSTAKSGITSPPAGTGNVPGLGESFSINLNTGQSVYSYKLPLPDGVVGHTPQLTLEYSHGSGLTEFGLGWRMTRRSIARRLDFGVPDVGVTERWMDSGNELVSVGENRFAAKVETLFTRYTRETEGWKIEERNGMVHWLGITPETRIADPVHLDRVQQWLLTQSLDSSGNMIKYTYQHDRGIAYLASIRYGAYAIQFVYGDRPDVRSEGRMGFVRQQQKRCQRVELYLDPAEESQRLLRTWTFSYELDPLSGVSLLNAIQMTSHGLAADGSDDVVRPPATFKYSSFEPQRYRLDWMTAPEGTPPPPLSDPDVALVTLDNAPLPGILQVVNGQQYYWRNRGDRAWAHPIRLASTPQLGSFARAGVALIDLDASGTADLVMAGSSSQQGYYANHGRAGWQEFVSYPRGKRTAPAWNSGRLRLTDSDGNGRIDAMSSTNRAFAVWLNQAEQGWAEPLLAPKGTGDDRPDVDLDDPTVFLADMTGDGLQDLVRVRSGRVEYWQSLGRGRFSERIVMANSPRLRDAFRNPDQLFLIDINGDGCADLIYVTAANIEIFINQNGQTFTNPIVIDLIPTPIPGTIRAVDMSGRGSAGLLWNSSRGNRVAYVYLDFVPAKPPYLLTQVENGSGLISQIDYRPAIEDFLIDQKAGKLWQTNFPFPLLVVAQTRERDRISGQVVETQYRYHEAHYEMHTRQFQGFRRSERIEIGDESRADTLTVFHYLMAQERLPGNSREYAALNGKLRRTEVYSLDDSPLADKPLHIEETDYGLQHLVDKNATEPRVFVFANSHRSEDRERTDDVRGEEKVYRYDAVGNVIEERHRGYGQRAGVSQPERLRITQIDYATSTAWLVDKPSHIVVRDGNNKLLTETHRYYDGENFVGLPLGQVKRGLLSREIRLILLEAEFQAHYTAMDRVALGYFAQTDADGTPAIFVNTERHAYDTRGLKHSDRDALGNDTRYEYDADGLFRTKLIDGLGETRFEYDRAIGQPNVITYSDGSQTHMTYDAQGRIRIVTLPTESPEKPSRLFTYDDSSIPNTRTVRFRQSADTEVFSLAITYFDGYGKEFQQRIQVDDKKYLVSALTVKNPWGHTKQEYAPTYSSNAEFSLPSTADKLHRQFFFDARGRAIKTINYNGGVSTASYAPFEVITADANDNDNSPDNIARGQFNTPKREKFDVFRYRTQTIETISATEAITTTYRSGVLGELLEVQTSQGSLATYEYDRLGNRLVIHHREAGDRRTWYDARSKAVRTLDANGNDIRATLDRQGRLTQLKVGDTVLESYAYDDLTQNALGRLAEVTYQGGSQAFKYDPSGRLVRHDYRFEGIDTPQTLTYDYDVLGREIAVTYTDGTKVSKELTPNGWIKSIPSILQQIEYNPAGVPTKLVYANGVVTDLTYTEGAARVKTQTTIAPLGQVMEQVTYDYDQFGLLLQSQDAALGGVGARAYRYDPLNQVRSATMVENGTTVTQTYDYTAHYNLTRFDETGSTFHYDDPLHPDRIMGIKPTANDRVNLTYDANGNLLSLPNKTFHYNFKNELERFESTDGLTAEYRYDHQGQRISKTVNNGHGLTTRTFFLGKSAEISTGQTVYFVHLGHLRVGMIIDGTPTFVHGDAQGNSAFFSNTSATKIAAIAYRPFGNLVSSLGSVDRRTYGLHSFDVESGLYYMQRRYYAPEIGRFLTPDPIAIYQPKEYMARPKSLHPYIYVGNDPLNNIDPMGLSFWSVVGAIVGVIAAALLTVFTAGVFGAVLGVALAIGITTVSYIVADATSGTNFGDFMRGFMIGMNAGLNAIIATALFGPVVGITLGVINFLAAFDTIANSSVYQGILGWSSWLMPMSWLATAVGLIFFVLNVIAVIFTVNQVDAVRIHSLSIDWGTGTIVMEGGMIHPIGASGFNLGNFTYIRPGGGNVVNHETGHTLSVAAFGSIFHFIGAIDENVIRANAGHEAYAERIAESHDPTAVASDIIPMWV
jgi:RHS repeat-associated protein